MWSNKEADFFPEINKSFTFPGMGQLPYGHTNNVKYLIEANASLDLQEQVYCA